MNSFKHAKMMLDLELNDISYELSNFYEEHKDLIDTCAYISSVVALACMAITIPKMHSKWVKDTTFVDKTTGLVWRSARRLSTEEKLVLEKRILPHCPGVGESLESMGILKS